MEAEVAAVAVATRMAIPLEALAVLAREVGMAGILTARAAVLLIWSQPGSRISSLEAGKAAAVAAAAMAQRAQQTAYEKPAMRGASAVAFFHDQAGERGERGRKKERERECVWGGGSERKDQREKGVY